jgi:hypothetical protein
MAPNLSFSYTVYRYCNAVFSRSKKENKRRYRNFSFTYAGQDHLHLSRLVPDQFDMENAGRNDASDHLQEKGQQQRTLLWSVEQPFDWIPFVERIYPMPLLSYAFF